MSDQDPAFDYVQHPTLGQLRFPKDMSPDERNAAITRAMAQQKTGLSPELRSSGSRLSSPGSYPPPNFFERMGIVPTAAQQDAAARANPLPQNQPGGASGEGGPGELAIQGLGKAAKASGKFYAQQGPGEVLSGLGEVATGDVKHGLNRVFSGGSVTLLPIAPEAIAANPAAALRAVLMGTAAGKTLKFGTRVAGGDEESQKLAENVGNLGGGALGGSASPKAALGKIAGVADVISPEVTGVFSPRAANLQRLLLRMRDASANKEPLNEAGIVETKIPSDPNSSEIPPNAVTHDASPSVHVPEKINSTNLMDQLKSGAVKEGFNDATQTFVRPSRMGTRQGIEDMLAAAKKGGSAETTARVDAHKVAKTEIGQNVAADETGIAETPKTGLAAFKQYGPNDPGYIQNPAAMDPVTASQIRAASSPNPPRSSLAKNQKQLASFNSKVDVENFQEQAAQELFGKSFKDLPVNDPLMRYKATLRATELQAKARTRK